MKEILLVRGGNILQGEVSVGGAKNSLVAIIPACIITKSIVKLENVMPIDDTYTLIKILEKLNVKTLYDGKSCMYIDARKVKNEKLTSEEVNDMRASYYFMGALLSLYNEISVLGPGGCSFCDRPIDLHLKAFNDLGFGCRCENNVYTFYKNKMRKKEIIFSKKSVGATVNAILASCRIKGSVVIKNCSLEPEIDDLINFLNLCGADVCRNEDSIIVKGVRKLHGCNYKIMFDRIEAGTFAILGGLLGDNLKIKNVNCEHIKSLIETLRNIGVKILENDNSITVSRVNNYKNIDIIIDSYPGFPTDLQQPLSVLLSACAGESSIKDTIYPARLSHIESLNKMNANIEVKDNLIVVNGPRKLIGSNVSGKDLRGGISLVVAALMADGESKIDGVKYIKRGYSDLVYKLNKIGANIKMERVDENETQIY